MKSILAEIRRREVLRVSAVYVVVAWVLLQVAEVVLPPLGFPDWSMRALIITAIVGFPVAFFLAWVIKIKPEGLIFDLPLWRGDSDSHTEHKTDYVVVAAITTLLVIGAYTIGVRLFREIPVPQTAQVSIEALPNSIAVLAFDNFSAEPDSEYFANGLAEEILNRLTGLRELHVAPRTSSFQFRDKQIGIREIARSLAVRYVLEGSVRQTGHRIKVTAKLIDSADGYPTFSRSYDRRLEDIFAIQEEIAAAVVNELQIALSVASEQRLQKKPTENLDAYVYYLQGRERLRSPPDVDVFDAASQLFHTALEMDPTFSRAYAGICEAQLNLYQYSNDSTHFDLAEAACDTAAELDPDLSTEVHVARGMLYRLHGWYERAEDQLEIAIAESPAAVDAYIELGLTRIGQGRRDEAEATFLRAIDLQKQDWRVNKELGNFYYEIDDFAEAVKYYEVASSLTPESAASFSDLGAAYWMLGEAEKARAAYDRSLELKPTRRGYTNMGLRYYYLGDFAAAADMQKKALEIAPDDHRVWGRLAESYRFMPDGETNALEAYTRAAELAEQKLKIKKNSWETIGLLGLYNAHLNQPDRARKMADRAVEISKHNPEALYFQALVRLKTGDQDGAIEALVEAVASNEQYRQFIESDPDLQSIKDNEAFARLLTP